MQFEVHSPLVRTGAHQRTHLCVCASSAGVRVSLKNQMLSLREHRQDGPRNLDISLSDHVSLKMKPYRKTKTTCKNPVEWVSRLWSASASARAARDHADGSLHPYGLSSSPAAVPRPPSRSR